MRFRTALLVGVVALIGAILATTVVAIRHVVDGAARQGLVDELARATAIIDDIQRFRQSALRAEVRMVAEEPRIKAVASTAEVSPETVLGVAQDLRTAIGSDLFLMTDSDGTVLADVGDPARAGRSLHDNPLIMGALRDGEAGGVWIVHERAVQVEARRLAFGDTTVGVLAIGRAYDDSLAETIHRQAGTLIAIELADQVIARSHDLDEMPSVAIGRTPSHAVVAGTRYLAIAVDIPGHAGPDALRYVVLADHDRAMAPGRALLQIIYAIAGISLLIAVVLAFLFAVRMSRPIDELVAFSHTVASGDLGTQAHISGPTELRALGTAVNAMVRELRSLTEGLEHRVEQRTADLIATTRELDERNRERESAEQDQRELLALVQRVSTDRDACEDFMHEAAELVAALSSPRDRVIEARALHTLKGNCAVFGFERYARLCHTIESELAHGSADAALTDNQRARIRAGWSDAARTMSRLLGDRARSTVEIDLPDLMAIVDEARGGASGTEIAPVLASWLQEPVRRRFDRLGRYAIALARRLGKGEIELAISDAGIRLDAARWAPLWSVLFHAVRNAVDHGFRPSGSTGSRPVLSLAARRTDDQLTLTIADNGTGIDWDAVRACVRRAGLPHTTHDDLVEALFADGISTRTEASDTSGRGVGLAAVRTAVTALGGTIEVQSQPGSGTCLTFRLPCDRWSDKQDAAGPTHTIGMTPVSDTSYAGVQRRRRPRSS